MTATSAFAIVPRAKWGARAATGTVYSVPLAERKHFVLHYLGAEDAKPDAKAQLRSVQKYHMDSNKWADIGYNFAVDQAGVVYEARGRDKVGAHCPNFNRNGIGVLVIVGDDDTPSEAAKASVVALHRHLEAEKKGDLAVMGHRDGKPTACPGDALYGWVEGGLRLPAAKPVAHAVDEDHTNCDHAKTPPPAAPVLRRGMQGSWVRVLQRHLRISEDGVFGPGTERAVSLLQNHWHQVNSKIVVDGVAGPQVWKILGVTG